MQILFRHVIEKHKNSSEATSLSPNSIEASVKCTRSSNYVKTFQSATFQLANKKILLRVVVKGNMIFNERYF